MKDMNDKVIAEIAQKNDTAEALFTVLGARERHARGGITRLPSLRRELSKEGFRVVPQELLVTFRELERAGIGTIKGNSFIWNYNLKHVAQAAHSAPRPAQMRQPAPVVIHNEQPKEPARPVGLRKVVLTLGAGKEVSFEGTTKEVVELVRELAKIG